MRPNLLCIQIESLAVLTKSKALDQAVAFGVVESLLTYYRTVQTGERTSCVDTGPSPAASEAISFGSHARQAILESLNAGRAAELRRIQRVLDQRWCERANVSSPINSIEDIEWGWEDRQQSLNARALESARAAGDYQSDADSAFQEWERSITAAERRLSVQEQLPRDKAGPLFSVPYAVAAATAAAFGLLAKIGGQSGSAVALTCLIGALLGMGGAILMRLRTKGEPKGPSAAARLSRQLLQPAADALVRHYHSREDAARLNVEHDQINAILGQLTTRGDVLRLTERVATEAVNRYGRGIFQPIDEGKVLLIGSDLVRELVRTGRAGLTLQELFTRILATFRAGSGLSLAAAARQRSSNELFQQLTAAASVHTGSISLAEVMSVVCGNTTSKQRFWEILDTLSRAGSSSVRLKRGLEFELDHTISPANCMFGLPGGQQDPLALIVRERFPDATFFHSFDSDAIEIYFDHRNLSRTDLLWDELSKEHYEEAPEFERQTQWHFPRRWRGSPETATGDPDQMPAAV